MLSTTSSSKDITWTRGRIFPNRCWLGTRGLLGVFLATSTTALRGLLGFDGTARELALSFGAALFVIAFVAPRILRAARASKERRLHVGRVPRHGGARPLIEALMQLARNLRQDALSVLKARISRRSD